MTIYLLQGVTAAEHNCSAAGSVGAVDQLCAAERARMISAGSHRWLPRGAGSSAAAEAGSTRRDTYTLGVVDLSALRVVSRLQLLRGVTALQLGREDCASSA